MRNASAHAGKNGRRVVSAFIATVFAQNDADAARRQWRAVADQLRPKMAKLAAFKDEAEPDVLAYMSFPAPHRAKLRSTNPLERLNLEQNDEWAVRRSRYMTLETIAAIGDGAVVPGLPNMAA
jgi:transposase-like protein